MKTYSLSCLQTQIHIPVFWRARISPLIESRTWVLAYRCTPIWKKRKKESLYSKWQFILYVSAHIHLVFLCLYVQNGYCQLLVHCNGENWSISFLSFALNLKHKDNQNNTPVDVAVTFSEIHALVLKGGTCEHQIWNYRTELVDMKTNTYLVFWHLWPRAYNMIKAAVLCCVTGR